MKTMNRLLAVILTVATLLVMVPFSAIAAPWITVKGETVDAENSTLTVTVDANALISVLQGGQTDSILSLIRDGISVDLQSVFDLFPIFEVIPEKAFLDALDLETLIDEIGSEKLLQFVDYDALAAYIEANPGLIEQYVSVKTENVTVDAVQDFLGAGVNILDYIDNLTYTIDLEKVMQAVDPGDVLTSDLFEVDMQGLITDGHVDTDALFDFTHATPEEIGFILSHVTFSVTPDLEALEALLPAGKSLTDYLDNLDYTVDIPAVVAAVGAQKLLNSTILNIDTAGLLNDKTDAILAAIDAAGVDAAHLASFITAPTSQEVMNNFMAWSELVYDHSLLDYYDGTSVDLVALATDISFAKIYNSGLVTVDINAMVEDETIVAAVLGDPAVDFASYVSLKSDATYAGLKELLGESPLSFITIHSYALKGAELITDVGFDELVHLDIIEDVNYVEIVGDPHLDFHEFVDWTYVDTLDLNALGAYVDVVSTDIPAIEAFLGGSIFDFVDQLDYDVDYMAILGLVGFGPILSETNLFSVNVAGFLREHANDIPSLVKLDAQKIVDLLKLIDLGKYLPRLIAVALDRILANVEEISINGIVIAKQDDTYLLSLDASKLIELADSLLPDLEAIANAQNNCIYSMDIGIRYVEDGDDTYTSKQKNIKVEALVAGNFEKVKALAGKIQSLMDRYFKYELMADGTISVDITTPTLLAKYYNKLIDTSRLTPEIKEALIGLVDADGNELLAFTDSAEFDDLLEILKAVDVDKFTRLVLQSSYAERVLNYLKGKGYDLTGMSADELIDLGIEKVPGKEYINNIIKNRFGYDVLHVLETNDLADLYEKALSDAQSSTGAFNRIKEKVESLLRRFLPAGAFNVSVYDLYDGNGNFNMSAEKQLDVEGLIYKAANKIFDVLDGRLPVDSVESIVKTLLAQVHNTDVTVKADVSIHLTNIYSISYRYLNGGTTLMNTLLPVGADLGVYKPDSSLIGGEAFGGWMDVNGDPITEMPAQDVVVYVQEAATVYHKVNFYNTDGQLMDSALVEEGTLIDAAWLERLTAQILVPENTGDHLYDSVTTEWTNAAGATVYPGASAVAADTNFYAKATPDYYLTVSNVEKYDVTLSITDNKYAFNILVDGNTMPDSFDLGLAPDIMKGILAGGNEVGLTLTTANGTKYLSLDHATLSALYEVTQNALNFHYNKTTSAAGLPDAAYATGALYDFSIKIDGAEYTEPFAGNLEITVPFADVLEANENQATHVYVMENGVLVPVTVTTAADGTVTFLAPHFSQYIIINEYRVSAEFLSGLDGSTITGSFAEIADLTNAFYPEGYALTLTPVLDSMYDPATAEIAFAYGTMNGILTSATFTMPAEAVQFTVTAMPYLYNVEYYVNGALYGSDSYYSVNGYTPNAADDAGVQGQAPIGYTGAYEWLLSTGTVGTSDLRYDANWTDMTVYTVTPGVDVTVSQTTATMGTLVNVSATDKEGYTYKLFLNDGTGEIEIVGGQFTMPAANVSIRVEYTAIDYTVSVTPAGWGSVSQSVANIGNVISVTLSAPEKSGYYAIYSVTAENGASVVINGNTFVMPASNVTVTVDYAPYNYNINLFGNVQADKTTAIIGDTVTVTFDEMEGYTGTLIVTDEFGNAIPLSGNSFTMPAANVLVGVEYTKNVYLVNKGDSSIVTSSGSATFGDEVTVSAPVKPYFEAVFTVTYTAAGGSVTVAIENGKFIMPAADVTVTLEYVRTHFDVNKNHPSMVTSTDKAAPGELVTVSVPEREGYTVSFSVSYQEAGQTVTVGAPDGKFIMPATDVEVYVTYEKIEYSVTVNTVLGGTTSSEFLNAFINDTIQPDIDELAGYTWAVVFIDGDGNVLSNLTLSEAGTFNMPASDVIVTVTYTAIDYSVNAEEGATPSKTTANVGETITVTVTEKLGYTSAIVVTDGQGANVAVVGNTFVMPADNVNVAVVYTAIEYNVTLVGNATLDKNVAILGETVTVTPATMAGYTVKIFTIDAAGVKTQLEGNTFAMPAGPITVYVEHIATVYTVTTEGNVNVSVDNAIAGETVTVTWNAKPGYTYALSVKDAEGKDVTVTNGSFLMPASNVLVTLTETPIKYTVGVDKNASIEPASPNVGDTVTVTWQPKPGFGATVKVTDADGKEIPVENGKFVMPAANITVTVEYAEKSYTVNVPANVATSATNAGYGDTVTLTPDRLVGYDAVLTVLDANGNAVTVKNGEFTMPDGSVFVSVSYTPMTVTYSIAGIESTGTYGEAVSFQIVIPAGKKLDSAPAGCKLVSYVTEGGTLTLTYVLILDQYNAPVTYKLADIESEIIKLYNGKRYDLDTDPVPAEDYIKFAGWSAPVNGVSYATFTYTQNDSMLWLWVLLIGLAVVVLVFVIALIIKKNKDKNDDDNEPEEEAEEEAPAEEATEETPAEEPVTEETID